MKTVIKLQFDIDAKQNTHNYEKKETQKLCAQVQKIIIIIIIKIELVREQT